MLTPVEVQQLNNAAIGYVRGKDYAPCTWLYRNKPRSHFLEMFGAGGVMKTVLKDASGDRRSPINGEISGLFFTASVDASGEPYDKSIYGDTRLLVRAEVMLDLAPHMYFADFYCCLLYTSPSPRDS